MIEHETFFTLIADRAHWEFELFLIVLFDLILGLLVWPWFRRSILHHISDDQKIAALQAEVAELREILGLPPKPTHSPKTVSNQRGCQHEHMET